LGREKTTGGFNMLEQRIQAERNRVSGEIQKLKKENEIDSEILNDLKQEYNAAILSNDENEIDFVNSNIKQVNGRISRRKEKIAALEDKNNPIIQTMISEELNKWLNELSILNKQAQDKYKELEPKQKELLNGLHQMVEMKKRVDQLQHLIKDFTNQLNETSKKKLGLEGYYGSDNKVLGKILPLLIEHREVFKVY
jgi:chromosome segregation ATPase